MISFILSDIISFGRDYMKEYEIKEQRKKSKVGEIIKVTFASMIILSIPVFYKYCGEIPDPEKDINTKNDKEIIINIK